MGFVQYSSCPPPSRIQSSICRPKPEMTLSITYYLAFIISIIIKEKMKTLPGDYELEMPILTQKRTTYVATIGTRGRV